MSAGQHGNPHPTPPTWTEPPWSGWIETTGDALLILEAARRGLIPRVTRRLVDSERKMITSGSVFVFDEDESGIKRWTDGFFWSPSRILGNFLLYRETDKRGSGQRNGKESDGTEFDNTKNDGSLSRPKSDPGHPGVDKSRERTLVGSLTNSFKFKPDGLMKKTFSLTIGGVAQHLISYYKIEDVESGRLRPPSSLPELASLEISPEYLDKTHFRNPPKVEIGADGVPRYRGEADDIDTSTSLITGPPLTGLPLLSGGREVPENGVSKRVKRYEPYAPSAPASKRQRKTPAKTLPASGDPQQSQSPPAQQDVITTPIASPTSPQPPHQPPMPQIYADPNAPVTSPGAASVPATSYPSFGVPPYYGYMQPPHVPIYSHQAPYGAISPTQTIPPPQTHSGQYTYAGYPPPMPGIPQPSPQAPSSVQASPPPPGPSNTPISPSDSSHSHPSIVTPSPTPTQPPPAQVQIQPGYYHPPPHVHPPPYYGPQAAPHPQMYSAYPPPPHVAHAPPPPPPTGVWGPPPHAVPHPYGAYAPPPPPPQQYSYGMYAPPPQGYQQQQQQHVHPQAQVPGYMYPQKPEQGQNQEEGKVNGHTGREGDEEGGESGE